MNGQSALSICVVESDEHIIKNLNKLTLNFFRIKNTSDFFKKSNSLLIVNESKISPSFLHRISQKSFLKTQNTFLLIITGKTEHSLLRQKFSSNCNRIFLTTNIEFTLTLKNFCELLKDFSRFDNSSSGIVFNRMIEKDKLDYQILLISGNVPRLLKTEIRKLLGNLSCDAYQTPSPPYLELYHQVAESGKAEKFLSYNTIFKTFFQIECFSFQEKTFFTAFQINKQFKEKKSINEAEMSAIFSELLNTLPAFGYICANDRNWTMKKIFGNFRVVTGYNPEEIIENRNCSFNDLVAPESREYLWEKWQKILKARLAFEDRYEIITREGQRRWVWERGFGVFSKEKLLYLAGFILDISQHKKLEKNYSDQQIFFTKLLDSLPLGIGLHRKNKIIYANPEALRLLKLNNLSEALQTDFFSFVLPEDLDKTKKNIRQIISSGKSSGVIKQRLIRADGKQFDAEIISTPIIFQNESALLVIFRDISQLKKIEKEKEASEQLLKTALLNLKDGVFIVDPKNQIIRLNQAAASLIAKKPEECYGQKIEKVIKLFDEETARPVYHLLRQTFLDEAELIERNLLLFSADGREIPVTISSSPLFDQQKKLFARIVVLRNEQSERNYRTFLLKERQRLQTYLDLAPLIIMVLDINANIVMINKKGAVILEAENSRALTGLNWPENFIPADQKKDFENTFKEFLKLNKEISAKQSEILTLGGNRRNVFWHGEILRDEEGAISGFLMVGEDITERLDFEKKLTAVEARYKMIVEMANDAIVTTDQDERITFCNQRMASLIKLSREDLLNRKFAELIHPDDMILFKKEIVQRASGIASKYEIRLLDINKETIFCLISASPIISPSGEFQGTFAFISDISDKKKTEEILRESEERYRLIVENSPAGIFYFNSNGTIISCNKKAVEIMDTSVEKIIGLNIFDLPDKRVVQAARQVIQGKSTALEGYYQAHTSQKKIYAQAFFTPIVNNCGKTVGGFAVIEDLTTTLSAREQEKRYRLIFENSPAGIFFFDPSGIITGCNDKFVSIIGSSHEKLIGLNLLKLPDQKVVAAVKKALQGKKAHYQGFYSSVTANKTTPVKAFFSPIFNEQHQLIGGFAQVEDLSAEIEAAAEKEKLQRQIQQMQKLESIGRLAGGVAHDFNNILQAIIGYADLALLSLQENHPAFKKLQTIKSAAEKSARLTRQLLAFARKQPISPQVINLNQKINESYPIFRQLIGEHVVLQIKTAPDLWNCYLDPAQFDQIALNLLVNSRDAITTNGKIVIETKNLTADHHFCRTHPGCKLGDYVKISFIDNGCGIPEENLPRIFDPFFSTKKETGTGLGLATVYGIIKQNNGFIYVESKVDVGTTFQILFPRCSAQEAIVTEESSGLIIPTQQPKATILVVEDEEEILELIIELLREKNFSVSGSTSPQEALRIAQNLNRLDLLISDMVMPEFNGRELYKRLQKIFPELKALFMSGYSEGVVSEEGILEKNLNFLAKPFEISKFLEIIYQLLR